METKAAAGFLILLLATAASQEVDVERRFACWGSVGPPIVSAQCQKNTVLKVVRAGLKVHQNGAGSGSECEYRESDCGCTVAEPGCKMPEVGALCDGETSCRLDVSQQYIDTASCQGFTDYMYIEYQCLPESKDKPQDVCLTMTQEHESGFLQTPNYPQTYPNNRHCECTLRVTSDSTIDLKILDLQLADQSCKKDEVSLEFSGQLVKLCGQSNGMQDVISTKSKQVKVVFDSDQDEGDNGFWIKYEANGPVKVSCRSIHKPLKESPEDSTRQARENADSANTVDPYPVIYPRPTNTTEFKPRSPEGTSQGVRREDERAESVRRDEVKGNNLSRDDNSQSPSKRVRIEDEKSGPRMGTRNDIIADRMSIRDDTMDVDGRYAESGSEGRIRPENSEGSNSGIDASNTASSSVIDDSNERSNYLENSDITEQTESDPEVSTMETILARTISFDADIGDAADDGPIFQPVYDTNEGNPETVEDVTVEMNTLYGEDMQNAGDGDATKSTPDSAGNQVATEDILDEANDTISPASDKPQSEMDTENHEDRIAKLKSEFNNVISQDISPDDDNVADKKRRQNINQNFLVSNGMFNRDQQQANSQSTWRFVRLDQRRGGSTRNNQNRRQNPRYDRFSFQRDMFEEYTDPEEKINNVRPPNRNIVRQGRRQQVLQNRNANMASRGAGNANPRSRNNDVENKDNLISINTSPQQNVRVINTPRVRVRPPSRNDASTNQRANPSSRNDAISNHRRANPSLIPALPWWWKFTAAKKENTLQPPTKAAAKTRLNEKMKASGQSVRARMLVVQDDDQGVRPEAEDTGEAVMMDGVGSVDNLKVNGEVSNVQTGLLESSLQRNGQQEDDQQDPVAEGSSSATVTMIAVAVIGMIIIIVVVGVVVRWVLNKREKKRALRHRHKKECAMRNQHFRHSSAPPRHVR